MSTPLALPSVRWADDLRRAAEEPPRWLWHGYLLAGAVTLLTSRWKAGKTTLLSVLLRKLAGGGELAGECVAPGRAVVVSEEPNALWRNRAERLDLGGHAGFLCRPFAGKPTADQWAALIDSLAADCARGRLDLAVIDPLAGFLPARDENVATAVLEALVPLHRLTATGAAVLLLHHPRKGGVEVEPRGSGALCGFADVLVQMDVPRRGSTTDRRRRLIAASRFGETPAERVIELADDGRDYALVSDPSADEFTTQWAVLRGVLEDARHRRTRREIWAAWPEDYDRPALSTLARWLERAESAGLVERQGTGRKRDPFRYWLPGRPVPACDLPPLDELPPLEANIIRNIAGQILRRKERGRV